MATKSLDKILHMTLLCVWVYSVHIKKLFQIWMILNRAGFGLKMISFCPFVCYRVVLELFPFRLHPFKSPCYLN